MSGKQSRPWADTAEYGIWSGATLFAQACMSQYEGLLVYRIQKLLLFTKSHANITFSNKKQPSTKYRVYDNLWKYYNVLV